jgi:hypothetical protein
LRRRQRAAERAGRTGDRAAGRRPSATTTIRCRRQDAKPPLRSADSAIVEKLRDQLAAGKFDRILGGKKDAPAVESVLRSRDFAPLWIADGAMSERGKAAAAYLPASMPTASIRANIRCRRSGRHGAGALGRSRDQVHRRGADLRAPRHERPRALQPRLRRHHLSTCQARSGQRAGPRRQGAGRAAALDSFNPPQPQYKALKAKLAECAAAPTIAKPVIAAGRC